MANRVEFELSADDRKAVDAAARLQEKVEALAEKYEQAAKKGKSGFGEVADSIGKVAMGIGMANGVGAAFNQMLEVMEGKAAALNREAQKALEIGRGVSAGAGRLLQNISGMSDAELVESQTGILDILRRNPAQGPGAAMALFDALTGVRSANPTLTNAQALGVVNEAAQTVQLDPRLPLADVAQGFGSLAAATGMSPNEIQNVAMQIQGQGFIADLSQVLKSAARLQPVAAATQTTPQESFGLLNFATKTLQDTGGEQSVTAVAALLTNLSTRADKIEDAIGLRVSGTPLQRLGQVVDFVRAGNVQEAELGKLLPQLAEGVAGKTLIQSLFTSGMGPLAAEVGVFAQGTQGDLTASQINRARRLVPGFDADFRSREQRTLTEAGQGLDLLGQRQAVLREGLIRQLEAGGQSDEMVQTAASRFDALMRQGLNPTEALQRASAEGALSQTPGVGASSRFFFGLQNMIGGRASEEERAAALSSENYAAAMDKLSELMAGAVERGIEKGFQSTNTRQAIAEGQ